jgi:hypothetical protein
MIFKHAEELMEKDIHDQIAKGKKILEIDIPQVILKYFEIEGSLDSWNGPSLGKNNISGINSNIVLSYKNEIEKKYTTSVIDVNIELLKETKSKIKQVVSLALALNTLDYSPYYHSYYSKKMPLPNYPFKQGYYNIDKDIMGNPELLDTRNKIEISEDKQERYFDIYKYIFASMYGTNGNLLDSKINTFKKYIPFLKEALTDQKVIDKAKLSITKDIESIIDKAKNRSNGNFNYEALYGKEYINLEITKNLIFDYLDSIVLMPDNKSFDFNTIKNLSDINITDMEISDINGFYPLYYLMQNKKDIAIEFIKKYPDFLNKPIDKRVGSNPLHFLCICKDFDNLNMFLNEYTTFIDNKFKDYNNDNLVSFALTNFPQNLSILQKIKDIGFDMNNKNKLGMSPGFHTNHISTYKFLINNGLDLNQKGGYYGPDLLIDPLNTSADKIKFLLLSGLNSTYKKRIFNTVKDEYFIDTIIQRSTQKDELGGYITDAKELITDPIFVAIANPHTKREHTNVTENIMEKYTTMSIDDIKEEMKESYKFINECSKDMNEQSKYNIMKNLKKVKEFYEEVFKVKGIDINEIGR